MNDFLETIVAHTRARVKNLAPACPQRLARPFAFSSALAAKRVALIAEIKSASPSAGTIIENPDVDGIAREYAQGGASAISIVTEPEFFRGSHDWLARAAKASGLPVLMKDFIIDQRQLLCGIAAGANAILILASLLDGERIREAIEILDDFGCDALVEVHDGRELERALDGGARIIGVNNRNLRDFDVDLRTAERLAKRIPKAVIKVAESGIKSRDDVERLRSAGFTAFLVGESLLRQNDRAAAVRALIA
ncbi:MAG TPA: indole-3-glycerol phosphate synthase TrpC [Thermoanaerobaculia bacterium]|nr:indole-3-glycerol phosphate synthase TrpC [Thermoanaerobaculia bacterium]